MNVRFRKNPFIVLLIYLAFVSPGRAWDSVSKSPRADKLQALLGEAVQKTLERFAAKKLATNELAVTLIDLRDVNDPLPVSYRGDIQIYPASIVKLFYLAATHHWMEVGKITETDEIRRAMHDMIVDSSNEATHYLVDLLTDTTSGPELSPEQLEAWYYKRNAVNRYFAAQGFHDINVNRKPWNEGPYGRESQSLKIHQPNHRNWLTTDSTARLMTQIVTRKAISPNRSAEMMKLLERDPFSLKADASSQARAFTGKALSPGDHLWSKAGWTSEARHDAAYVELAGGEKFVLVTFTMGHATDREIIPYLARRIIDAIQSQR